MAFTSYGKDIQWVMPGDVVTLAAVYTVGTRFRCKLVDKPHNSQLELFDEAKENWLSNNQIVPDVGGRYSITFVEETVTIDVPHFSNDLGAGAGIEQVTAIGDVSYVVTVCKRVVRDIGVLPDKVQIELWGACDDDVSSPTYGVLTYLADRTKCPRLITDGSSDPAVAAAYATATALAVEYVGGYGDATHKWGDLGWESGTIIPWDDVISDDPIGDLGHTIWNMNEHIAAVTLRVHGAADAVNAITAADAATGNAASQVALLNDILAQIAPHAILIAGPVHACADTIAQAECAALAPLGGGATLTERIDRTNALREILGGHLPRGTMSLITYDAVHYYPGDFPAPLLISEAWTEGTAVTLMNLMKTYYEAHRAKVVLVAAGYHAAAGTAENFYNEQVPLDREGYIKAVGGALDIFHAHVTNRNPTTGATVAYHTAADWAHRADMLGKPTDFASAVVYHEILDHLLTKHVQTASDVHSTALYLGRWYKVFKGLGLVHSMFRDSLVSSTGTVPLCDNYAAAKLIMLGGCVEG